ncbi:MAG: outer membrane protein transport protein [Bacteroidota bacterium]
MNYCFDHPQKGLMTALLKKTGLVLAGLLLLVPAQSLLAQSAEDALLFTQRLPATGARSIGLAGAGRAGLADYSAFYTNPAGLGFLRTSQVSGALSFLSATNDAQVNFPNSSEFFTEELTDQSLGNFAGAFKVPTNQGSLVIGGAFNQTNSFERTLSFAGLVNSGSITDVLLPFDDEFEVVEENGSFFPAFFSDLPEIAYLGGAIEFLPENVGTGDGLFYQAVNPGSTIEQASDVFQEGRMKDFSFGGAFEAARGVMVGAALNFNVGSYEFQSVFDEFDINNENTEDLYIVLDGDNELRGFDLVTYEERFISDLVGANLRLGVSAMANKDLRVGITLESPTFYRVDERFDTIISTEFDNGAFLSYGGLSGDVGRGTFEYDITTPWRFGAGLAYEVSGLTIMGDIEFVDWTQLELDANVDRDLFNSINRTIRNDFQAVINTRIAGEFSINNLMLRAGYAFQPDPIDTRLTGTDGSSVNRDKAYLSAGLGYKFSEKFVIDVGWMQERQDDLYAPDFVDYVVNEEVTRSFFVVGMSVLF